jgi:hypothetical protein
MCFIVQGKYNKFFEEVFNIRSILLRLIYIGVFEVEAKAFVTEKLFGFV